MAFRLTVKNMGEFPGNQISPTLKIDGQNFLLGMLLESH